ncbi:AmmeMemoRadiSam system protein A [Thermodesulfobacteriota bacterium]
MGIYKKNKRILQELLFNLSIPGFLCLILFTLMSFAQGKEFHDSLSGEKKNAKQGIRKEIKMSDKGELSREEGKYLLTLARATIEEKLFKKDISQEESNLPDKFLEKRAVFVTLNLDGNLRGCIGHIVPQVSLVESIKSNALSAAFKDPRFPPLSKEEWKNIEVEISILTVPEQLKYTDAEDLLEKLRPGIDGVILRKNYHQSTFLPQVWDQLSDKTEFLEHLCMKAGMDANEWKKGDITVYTYQVQAFEEH